MEQANWEDMSLWATVILGFDRVHGVVTDIRGVVKCRRRSLGVRR